jgi:hypothetical protein
VERRDTEIEVKIKEGERGGTETGDAKSEEVEIKRRETGEERLMD